MAQTEGGREEIGQSTALRGDNAQIVGPWEKNGDGGGLRGELEQSLPAGSAGHGASLVEVRDCNSGEANGRAEARNGRGNSSLLGTCSQAKACVLYVAAGDDLAGMRGGEKKGSADAKSAVWGMGVLCGSKGTSLQLLKVSQRDERVCGGGDSEDHAVLEATRRAAATAR